MSDYFLGSRASVHVVVGLEDKHHNNQCLPSCSFLLAFVAEQMLYGMEYPLGHLGSAVLAVPPPKTLPTPSLLVWGGGWRGSLDAGAEALVCYHHLSSHRDKHSPVRAAAGLSQPQCRETDPGAARSSAERRAMGCASVAHRGVSTVLQEAQKLGDSLP